MRLSSELLLVLLFVAFGEVVILLAGIFGWLDTGFCFVFETCTSFGSRLTKGNCYISCLMLSLRVMLLLGPPLALC